MSTLRTVTIRLLPIAPARPACCQASPKLRRVGDVVGAAGEERSPGLRTAMLTRMYSGNAMIRVTTTMTASRPKVRSRYRFMRRSPLLPAQQPVLPGGQDRHRHGEQQRERDAVGELVELERV